MTLAHSSCNGDSLRLTATAQETLQYDYRWFRNGVLIPDAATGIYFAKQSGEYSAELSYSANCTWKTAIFAVTSLPKPDVQIIGLPDEISLSDNAISLAGEPSGGVFAGKGVSGNTFDPKTAGAGVHKISYSFTAQNGCTSVAEKTITVKSSNGVNETTPREFTAEILPNPAEQSARLRLFLSVSSEISIRIMNSSGKEVFTQKLKLNAGENALPIENLAAGAYHLRIVCDKHSETLPFTIIR